MSEENSEEQLEDTSEAYTSPLRILLTEIHEVYQELVSIGFPDKIATMIVAHMIQDSLAYRDSDEDEDDENDEQDDTNDDRGPL